MLNFREYTIHHYDRIRWKHYYLDGPWNVFAEYGDRAHAFIEPCVRLRLAEAYKMKEGLRCHQVAYIRYHRSIPEEGQVIAHYCRNPLQLELSSCLTVSHMHLTSQPENRSDAACHNRIVEIANKEIARRREHDRHCHPDQKLGPLIAPQFYPDCPHGDENGNGRCFINYGKNKNVNELEQSFSLYVLRD